MLEIGIRNGALFSYGYSSYSITWLDRNGALFTSGCQGCFAGKICISHCCFEKHLANIMWSFKLTPTENSCRNIGGVLMRTMLNLNIVVKIKYKSNLLGITLISHKDHTIPVFQSMDNVSYSAWRFLIVLYTFYSELLSNYLQLVTSTWSKKMQNK